MYQQSLDLQFPLTQQLSFDFPLARNLYCGGGLFSTFSLDPQVCITGTTSYGLSETVTIEAKGVYIHQENKSWLKTKVANWLGFKYL